jgi:hypothetical protein
MDPKSPNGAISPWDIKVGMDLREEFDAQSIFELISESLTDQGVLSCDGVETKTLREISHGRKLLRFSVRVSAVDANDAKRVIHDAVNDVMRQASGHYPRARIAWTMRVVPHAIRGV